MQMEQIVNLLMNNGTTIVVLAYLLWKDSKLSDLIVTSQQETKDTLSVIKQYLEKLIEREEK